MRNWLQDVFCFVLANNENISLDNLTTDGKTELTSTATYSQVRVFSRSDICAALLGGGLLVINSRVSTCMVFARIVSKTSAVSMLRSLSDIGARGGEMMIIFY